MKRKYAIYQSKIGLYEWEYVDSMEALQNYMIAPFVKKEDLPIIINRAGGKTSFDQNDKKFVEIRECEEDEYPLSREEMYPKNSKDFEYGWIDLDGNTYNTGYEGHSYAAEFLCKEFGYKGYSYEHSLEEMGWVKITAHWEDGARAKDVFATNCFITKKQADTLFDLGLYESRHVRRYIKMSENNW